MITIPSTSPWAKYCKPLNADDHALIANEIAKFSAMLRSPELQQEIEVASHWSSKSGFKFIQPRKASVSKLIVRHLNRLLAIQKGNCRVIHVEEDKLEPMYRGNKQLMIPEIKKQLTAVEDFSEVSKKPSVA